MPVQKDSGKAAAAGREPHSLLTRKPSTKLLQPLAAVLSGKDPTNNSAKDLNQKIQNHLFGAAENIGQKSRKVKSLKDVENVGAGGGEKADAEQNGRLKMHRVPRIVRYSRRTLGKTGKNG